jgi:O-antigen/teichoic acid export membrane protein
MAFVLLPSCFGLSAIMPTLVPVLYGPQFADATNVAIVLVCGAGFVTSTTVAANVIWAMERTDVEFKIGLAGAVLALVLDITIIPRYGPLGAAFCRVAVQSFVAMMMVGFLVRKLHYSLPLLELGKIFLSALACALAAGLSLQLVPGPAGLPLAIGLGAIVYLISVRYCGALPEADIARFRSLAALLPSALAGPAHRVLNALAPRKPVIASGLGSPDL